MSDVIDQPLLIDKIRERILEILEDGGIYEVTYKTTKKINRSEVSRKLTKKPIPQEFIIYILSGKMRFEISEEFLNDVIWMYELGLLNTIPFNILEKQIDDFKLLISEKIKKEQTLSPEEEESLLKERMNKAVAWMMLQ